MRECLFDFGDDPAQVDGDIWCELDVVFEDDQGPRIVGARRARRPQAGVGHGASSLPNSHRDSRMRKSRLVVTRIEARIPLEKHERFGSLVSRHRAKPRCARVQACLAQTTLHVYAPLRTFLQVDVTNLHQSSTSIIPSCHHCVSVAPLLRLLLSVVPFVARRPTIRRLTTTTRIHGSIRRATTNLGRGGPKSASLLPLFALRPPRARQNDRAFPLSISNGSLSLTHPKMLSVAVALLLLFAPPQLSALRIVSPLQQHHLDQGDLARLSPNTLAYVGDSVLELFWRLKCTWPPGRLVEQQQRVVEQVRAEEQARILAQLTSSNATFILRDLETSWIKRGRNAVSRRGPVRLKASVYQDASGLECLVGFLYLSDYDRCVDLLNAIQAMSSSREDDIDNSQR